MSNRKKRTRRAPPKNVQRLRRIREHVGDIAVDLTTPCPDVNHGVEVVQSDQNEELHLEVRFVPSLSRQDAAKSCLNLLHIPTKRTIGQVVILPYTNNKDLRRFEQERQVYMAFPSHAVRFDWEDGMLVQALYVKVVNVEMDGNRTLPHYVVHFEYTGHDRIKSLEYYPPIKLLKQDIDARTYPQRLAMSFKPKTGLTSSRVAKKLGYYPGPDNFNQWKRLSMRFGRRYEVIALLNYLSKRPSVQFQETGFHETDTCAAQPDGLLTDPDAAPTTGQGFEHLDVTRGIIEIKCSTTNCNFEGPHVAQAMWEMMAVNVAWCDLVRYCERQVLDTGTRKWHTVRTIRIIRMYRNKAKDQALLEAVQNEEKALEMRQQLNNMAYQANKREQEQVVDDTVHQMLDSARNEYFAQHAMEVDVVDPALDRIEKRQALIFDHFQTDREGVKLRQEVAAQIQDLAQMLTPP